MDWSAGLEFGSVGILTLLLVEFGKRVFPGVFAQDGNVWMSVTLAIIINGIYAFSTGGDVWASIPQGATVGLAVSGAYRGVSLAAKKNAVDLTEQVDVQAIAQSMKSVVEANDDVDDDGMKIIKGFGK